MNALELKVPPLLLFLAVSMAMHTIAMVNGTVRLPGMFMTVMASGMSLAACLLIGSSVISFRRAQTTVNPTTPEGARVIVDCGVFALTRNPMYLAFTLLLAAQTALIANPLVWLVPFGFAAYLHRFQIRPEEKALSERFGRPYLDYQRRVRRWL